MEKLYKFLETGNNKLIIKIVDAVVICILSVVSLYFCAQLISADTAKNYLETVLKNFIYLAIFGGIDVLLILFTKPLFGFTSVIENHKARKTIKEKEKATKKAIEETAKETLRLAKEARRAEKARDSK